MSPADLVSAPGQPLFLGAGAFGALLGLAFVVAGIRGRQIWFAVWGGMLAVASIAYLTASGLGF